MYILYKMATEKSGKLDKSAKVLVADFCLNTPGILRLLTSLIVIKRLPGGREEKV